MRQRADRKKRSKTGACAAAVSTDSVECKEVAFHHAGYDPKSSNPVMFRLRGSKNYKGGVYAGTAMLILHTILDKEISQKVSYTLERGGRLFDLGYDSILNENDYYIHCPNPENPEDLLYQFPVVPGLSVWEYPRSAPLYWSLHGEKSVVKTRSTIDVVKHPTGLEWPKLCNKAVIGRDKHCVLSGAPASRCERAYLIPKRERYFYKSEMMSTYMGERSKRNNTIDIHHPMNGITLRLDLLQAYDVGDFVFVPVGEHWIAHFFDPTSPLGREYDQRPIKLSQEIPRPYLLVRVAIAAFALAKDFLEQKAHAPSSDRSDELEVSEG